MNWRQLQALVWLRWRLMANGIRRGGSLGAVPIVLVTVVALVLAVLAFVAALVAGMLLFPRATPQQALIAWDVVVLAFLTFWMAGLLTELQRTETLSLSKLLHLPLSVNGAFLINYLSSLLRLSMVIFAPALVALFLALVATKGIAPLVVAPALAAFLLMVTALTYQFQGWLASLMTNPRRRRAIIVGATLVFVLIFQLPNLLNLWRPWGSQRLEESRALTRESDRLSRAFDAGEIDAIEHQRLQEEALDKHHTNNEQADRDSAAYWERTLRLANTILPIGWLPLAASAAGAGNVLPALLGTLGMTAIGAASLARAYRTTIRIYQGGYTASRGRTAPAVKVAASPTVTPSIAVAAAPTAPARPLLVERRLPWLSEPVSVIALASFRSLVRSPEAKMMLLSPIILCAVFGSTMLRGPQDPPAVLRPMIGIGAMGFVLLGMLQLMANQFGFDRDGFRVYVLSPVPRRDILLGKNLAFLPIALGVTSLILAVVLAIYPPRWDHALAWWPQFLAMFLVFSPVANLLSIYAPMYIAAGSFKPANSRLLPVLLQLGIMFCVLPVFLTPTLLPLAIEIALVELGWITRAPVFLALSLVELAAAVVIYRLALRWQGDLLEKRERTILDVVTRRAA